MFKVTFNSYNTPVELGSRQDVTNITETRQRRLNSEDPIQWKLFKIGISASPLFPLSVAPAMQQPVNDGMQNLSEDYEA